YLGSGMIALYNQYFRFPLLDYRLSADVAAGAVAGSLLVAALGAQAAVRRAVRIPPAEAMRPAPPALYRRSLAEVPWISRRLTHATRMVLRNIERQPFRALASVVGIAFATAILLVGFSFIDVMDELIDRQFVVTMRQDATVTFAEPRGAAAVHAVARLPGVMRVEPVRAVPARLRAGHRSRTLAVTGLPASPTLNRIVDRSGRVVTLPPEGLVLSKMLGAILGVAPGDRVRVEVLEGRRPVLDCEVASLVDDNMGLQAYMEIGELHRRLREGRTVSSVNLMMDPAETDALYHRLKLVPAVAGVALTRLSLENFRSTLAENMNLMVFFNVFFAGIIAFGVVYNSARVSLSERSRELASLRVLGFTRAEISLILLGELAIVTVVALPVGAVIGYGLGELMVAGLNNEVYRMPFLVTAPTVAWAFLTVIGATLVSALAVRRRLDRLDLVGVLKTRE
ncbi:MAG: ABC transporter permease, partial [Vicinamibacterales bacterium]